MIYALAAIKLFSGTVAGELSAKCFVGHFRCYHYKMVSLGDKGSTRSGRTYLPDYLDRVPFRRHQEIIEKLFRSNKFEVENLSYFMEIMSIHRKTPKKPEKTLRENTAPNS